MTIEASNLSNETPHPGMGHHHEIHFFVDGEPVETTGGNLPRMKLSRNSDIKTRRRTTWLRSTAITASVTKARATNRSRSTRGSAFRLFRPGRLRFPSEGKCKQARSIFSRVCVTWATSR